MLKDFQKERMDLLTELSVNKKPRQMTGYFCVLQKTKIIRVLRLLAISSKL